MTANEALSRGEETIASVVQAGEGELCLERQEDWIALAYYVADDIAKIPTVDFKSLYRKLLDLTAVAYALGQRDGTPIPELFRD